MPVETFTKNGQASAPPAPTRDEELRYWARRHVERVRRIKLHIGAFLLGMAVLTPVWAIVEWQDNGGFERWGNDGTPASGSRGSCTSASSGAWSSESWP